MPNVVTIVQRRLQLPADRLWDLLDTVTPPGVRLPERIRVTAVLDRGARATDYFEVSWDEPFIPPPSGADLRRW